MVLMIQILTFLPTVATGDSSVHKANRLQEH